MEGLVQVHKEGKLPELKVKRLTPPNLKHLRYSDKLPAKCDECPYRAKEASGSGDCTQYEEGGLCSIRADIRKIIEEYSERSAGAILPILEEEFEANYEKLKFFERLETMKAEINPEVTKRIAILDKLGKTINELKTTKQTVEISETKTLSPEKREEISRMISIKNEASNEAST